MASAGERNSRHHPRPLYFEALKGTDPTPNPSPWRGGEWDAEAFTPFRGKACLQAPPLQGEGLGVGSVPFKVSKGRKKDAEAFTLLRVKARLQAPPLQGEGLGVGSVPFKVSKGRKKDAEAFTPFRGKPCLQAPPPRGRMGGGFPLGGEGSRMLRLSRHFEGSTACKPLLSKGRGWGWGLCLSKSPKGVRSGRFSTTYLSEKFATGRALAAFRGRYGTLVHRRREMGSF